jgi:hypothetical protein
MIAKNDKVLARFIEEASTICAKEYDISLDELLVELPTEGPT